jgi:hypothetical protein
MMMMKEEGAETDERCWQIARGVSNVRMFLGAAPAVLHSVSIMFRAMLRSIALYVPSNQGYLEWYNARTVLHRDPRVTHGICSQQGKYNVGELRISQNINEKSDKRQIFRGI